MILAMPSGMRQALIRSIHLEFSFRSTLIKPPRGELYSLTAQSFSSLTGRTSGLPSTRSYLGAQYRRLRGKLGTPKAITAMAHKLAVLVYRMLRWGHEYVDKGMAYYEERHREQQIRLLHKRAAKLGMVVV